MISMLQKTQLLSFDWSNNTGAINVRMYGSVLEETYCKILGLDSLLNWTGALALSLFLKLDPRKLERDLFYELYVS